MVLISEMTFKNNLLLILFMFYLLITSACKGERWTREWEEKFESYQPSETIMNIIGIKPGMAVAEIGAGNGRFIVRVAKRVGKMGRVFANDINTRALQFMKKRVFREKITNMVVVEGLVDNPLLPEKTMDMIYIINSFSYLRQPVKLLKNTIPSLKPGGRLAIIEYDPHKRPDLESHATHKETVINQARQAGFKLIHTNTILPIDNIYIFEVLEQDRKK